MMSTPPEPEPDPARDPGPRRPADAASALADRIENANLLQAFFDASFRRYVTRRLAGPLYVVGLVLVGLGIVYGVVASLVAAIGTDSFWGVLVFLLGFAITCVGALLAVLLLRVGAEVCVALVEIAENTRALRRRPR